jgi:CHAD domain-containing protein
MRSNGSHSLLVSPTERQFHAVFQRMGQQIGRIAKTATPDNVHRFRTNSRRVEALVSELTAENGNQKKLLKLLSKLRKKAGKVRDLDVQIAFLKELRVPDRHDHRAQLLEWLETEQARRQKKLTKSLDTATVEGLRKRLRRVQGETQLEGVAPMQLARKRLPNPGTAPLSEKMLHACRIEGKRARYLAELAADTPEGNDFVEQLKTAQDAIGEWHDIMKLKEKAEQMFGGVHDSPLVAVLQNISRAKFRRATGALLTTVAALSVSKKTVSAAPDRKQPQPELEQSAVA